MSLEENVFNSKHANRLIHNSVISFINSTVGMILGFAVSILTARMLGPEKYGIYNVTLWFMSVVSTIAGMGLNFAVTKFVSEHQGKTDRETTGRIIRFVLWIEISLGVITTFLLISQSRRIADYFFNPDYMRVFIICFVGLVPGLMTAVYSSAIEGIQQFRYFLYYSLFITPVSLITKVIILLNGGSIEGLLWTNLFYSVINTLFYRAVLYKEKLPIGVVGVLPKGNVIKRIIKYNYSISTIMLLDKIIWDKSENFFLGKFCAASQAGMFNIAYGFSNKFTSIIQSTFWKVLFPFMSERIGAEDKARMERVFYLSTRYLAFLAFPISAAGIVLSWPLIKYALGQDYLPAQRALQIFFFCSAFGQLATPQAAVLYAVDKQNFIVKYGIILAVVNLILDYLFIPRYGAVGAAAVNGGIRIIAYAGGIIYTIRVTNIRLPLKSLFKILYSSLIMAVLMQVVIKLNSELLGFIISIPIGIIVYLGSSIFIGTFEVEDKVVFRKLALMLPKRFDNFLGKVSQRFWEEKSNKKKMF